ncbi:MAG: DUF2812 domain-containing protein [Clostridia bacterium]|nr:DUF2812 domain-containing protein [Clostridia bacterium]
MKDTKKRMEIFSTYDFSGIVRHLTKMARRGWMLEEIGNYTWKYRRCEPADVRFAVTYFPQASAFDPEPGEDQQTYIDYCEEAGWELCASAAKMQVFRAVTPDAVEIETDADVQLASVHRSMKASYLPWCWTMLVFGILESAMELDKILRDPIEYLLGMHTLVMTAAIVILTAAELLNYGIWYLRAKKSLKNGGGLPKTIGTRPLQIAVLVLILTEFLLWIGYSGVSGSIVTALVSMAAVFAMLGATFGIRAVLKKKKVDAGLSKVIVMTACVLIPVICVPLLGIVTFNVIMNGTFSRAEVVEDAGMKIRVYHDELPLCVEDFTEVPDDAVYSRQLERKASPMIRRIEGKQQDPMFEARSLPDLEYTVTITEIGWIYEIAKEEVLAVDPLFDYTYDVILESDGCTVYRMNYRGDWGNQWIFVMTDRVAELYFDEPLTEDELDFAAEKIAEM